jgi:hypothetical protein
MYVDLQIFNCSWACFVFYIHFTYRKTKLQVPKTTMPRGVITELLLGLGIWASYFCKVDLTNCTKTKPLWNQINGVSSVGSRIFCFFTNIHALYIETEQMSSHENDYITRLG